MWNIGDSVLWFSGEDVFFGSIRCIKGDDIVGVQFTEDVGRAQGVLGSIQNGTIHLVKTDKLQLVAQAAAPSSSGVAVADDSKTEYTFPERETYQQASYAGQDALPRGGYVRGGNRRQSWYRDGGAEDMYSSQESLHSNDGSKYYGRRRPNNFRRGGRKQESNVRKLFVGRLDYGTTVRSFRDYFEQFGTVVDAFIPRKKGFGFVEFSDAYMAREVLNARFPHNIDGCKVVVEPREEDRQKEPREKCRRREKDKPKERELKQDDEEVDDEEIVRKTIDVLSKNEGTENMGSVALKLGIEVNVLKKNLLDNRRLFELNDATKKIKLKLSICRNYHTARGCAPGNCNYFHLCRDYVSGGCKSSDDCDLGHSLDSYHNTKVRENMFLDEVSNDTLLEVLSKVDGLVLAPLVCLPYNRNKCSNSNCNDLHVCLTEVTSQCDNVNCQVKNHDILSKECKELLEKRRIPVNQSRKEILTLITQRLRNNKEVQQFVEDVKQEKANRRSLMADKVEEGDVEIPEICIPYLNRKCRNDGPGLQCKRLHSKHNYQWQIFFNNKWLNLMPFLSDQLEQNYTDVNTDSLVIEVIDPRKLKPDEKIMEKVLGTDTWTANYKAKFKLINSTLTTSLDLRRLGTESSVNTSDPHATEWHWYFKDDHKKWIQYGQISSKGKNSSSVDSNVIEKEYQQNPNGTMTFSTQQFSSYTLDFKTLRQKNIQIGTERRIRRRPLLSQQGSSATLTTKGEYRHLPRNWVQMSPNEQYKLVALQQQTSEYQEISTLFCRTLRRTPTIQSIERVQNPYLREMYENRKKHMSKCLGKAENTIEIRLFHGTNPNNVDAIASQNFDWRLHGTASGQAYGRGVYFASTSAYSDRYATPGSQQSLVLTAGIRQNAFALQPLASQQNTMLTSQQKKMFIAKVLVGNMVTGTSQMIRPPSLPGNAQASYDTSVNNTSNPSIYVKYADQEMYPDYVVTYM